MSGSQFFCTGCGFRLMADKRFCTNCGKPMTRPVTPGVPVTASGSLPPGALMGGRWQVSRQLGKGGMGAVYLVSDTRLNNRRAALKEMLDGSVTYEARHSAIERFNREAETLAALTHPSVPHIYDRFAEGDRFYMVMEFVDGMDLEKLLEAFRRQHGTPLPDRVVARLTFQLCSVLDHIHKQETPTLHRDLKPSNVVLQPNGMVKLIDFGIAKMFNPAGQGTGLGTQGYAAPEQYKGIAEPRTDLYALGATLHHLLTGRDPQLDTPFEFPPISQFGPCQPNLEELVMQMLEMKLNARPSSAGEIRRRLLAHWPDIADWPEDPRIAHLLGAKPRPVTRRLELPDEAPAEAQVSVSQLADSVASSPPVPVAATTAPTAPSSSMPLMPMAAFPASDTPAQSGAVVPAPAVPAPPATKFCTQCGAKVLAGAKFCTGCGATMAAPAPPPDQAVAAQPPVPPAPETVAAAAMQTPVAGPPKLPSSGLMVPASLAGTAPLELIAFDDGGDTYCLIGVVAVDGVEYAFVTPGVTIAADAPVDVYVQLGAGMDAAFEPADLNAPNARSHITLAWDSLAAQSA